jgi:hypothetical protein
VIAQGGDIELFDPELLVVRAWRTIILGRSGCRLLGRMFGPPDGIEVIEAIATFLRALSHGSRHMLNVGHPGCPNITSDERQMLAVIAASQADNHALLLSHLSWLVRRDRRDEVAQATHALGRLLTLRGMGVPLPALQAFPAASMLAVVRESSCA